MSKKSKKKQSAQGKQQLVQSQPLPLEQDSSASKIIQHVATAGFSGPIPPPSILSEYDQITPGLAERIVSMAETEASHRHGMDTQAISADISFQNKMFAEARLGQVFGLIIGVTAIAAGAYTAVNGAQWPGGIIGGGGVIGLVSVFIYGRKHSDNQQPPQEVQPPQEPQ